MSNFTETHDKLATHLQELYEKHKTLDEDIKIMYNSYVKDGIINRKKTQKLWLKDEIHRLEEQLKQLG
jgi:hypothetical protein